MPCIIIKEEKISGEAIQSVPSNSYGTPVTAVADEGYTFVGWSDLLSEAIRQDGPTPNAHVQNINQVAIFEKNQKTYITITVEQQEIKQKNILPYLEKILMISLLLFQQRKDMNLKDGI